MKPSLFYQLEKRHEPLAPLSVFFKRLRHGFISGFLTILITLYLGMSGYHFLEKMSWIDAFANASMILSGMGPLAPLKTAGGKIFAGFYALFSGLTFIFIIGLIFGPIFHRFFHKFHIGSDH